MDWLNYHHLYYFYVVSNEGSIINARKVIKLGQSKISSQLKQFEKQLGFDLFIRSRHTLELTEIGERIYKYAQEIFAPQSECSWMNSRCEKL